MNDEHISLIIKGENELWWCFCILTCMMWGVQGASQYVACPRCHPPPPDRGEAAHEGRPYTRNWWSQVRTNIIYSSLFYQIGNNRNCFYSFFKYLCCDTFLTVIIICVCKTLVKIYWANFINRNCAYFLLTK